jgi:hypothetical protein
VQCLGDVPVVEIAREDDDGSAGRHIPDAARELEAIEARHGDVGDEDVRVETLDQRQHLEAVGGLAHDFEIGLALEQTAQRLPHHLLVVSKQNAVIVPSCPTRSCKKDACWRARC